MNSHVSSKDVSNLSDDEILFLSEKEKEKVIKYDNNGKPLYYLGNNTWGPTEEFVSKEEILKAKSRYPRPRIYPYTIIRKILTPFILIGLIIWFIFILGINKQDGCTAGNFIKLGLIILSFYVLLHLSDIAIFAITLYQKFAKDEVRERCQLTPTCSFYGIYSFQKYGFVIGLIKTICRLHRCEGQNEIDEP